MRRRSFTAGALALAAAPGGARAQGAGRVARVGFLGQADRETLAAFMRGMAALGWTLGHNLVVEQRWLNGEPERVDRLVDELLASAPDVVVCNGAVPVAAMLSRTKTVPIVIGNVSDPVAFGFVASLARPGGNVTGVTSSTDVRLIGKLVGLLKDIVPGLVQAGFVGSPDFPPTTINASALRDTGRQLGVTVNPRLMRVPDEIETVLAAARADGDRALIVQQDGFTLAWQRRIAAVAVSLSLPSAFSLREAVVGGGLVSYGVNTAARLERVAAYVDKILRGAKPGDLPVEQPIKFEMVLNMTTARALGIEIPPLVEAQADEVIE